MQGLPPLYLLSTLIPPQGLSRFASDIIIRGFDTPCKLGFYDGVGHIVLYGRTVVSSAHNKYSLASCVALYAMSTMLLAELIDYTSTTPCPNPDFEK